MDRKRIAELCWLIAMFALVVFLFTGKWLSLAVYFFSYAISGYLNGNLQSLARRIRKKRFREEVSFSLIWRIKIEG